MTKKSVRRTGEKLKGGEADVTLISVNHILSEKSFNRLSVSTKSAKIALSNTKTVENGESR